MLQGFLNLFNKDSLLDQALRDTDTMLQQVEAMVRVARQALRETDKAPLDLDISGMDQVVNRYESEVRRKVFTHLSVMGTEQVYPSLVLVSIIIDVERVGDYAKNIVELAREHEPQLKGGPFEEELQRIEEHVLDRLLPQGRQAFQQNAEQSAAALIAELYWINPACDRIANILVAGKQAVPLDPCTQVTLALYVRYLKRINSHWLNILTSVVNPFDRIGFRRAPQD